MAAMWCAAALLAAADLKVIANSSVTEKSISAADLKLIYLQTKSSVGGVHVEPVLAKGGNAHDAFLAQYVGKTDSALSAYYRSLVFTGKAAMPKAFASDDQVVAYVSKTKGAIGYVSADAATDGVTTLEVK
jgi:ABC-type phosphate transport system substrate-binding protein